ncbi:MAG: 1-deoxy-D-xylulose-5-phosphate reductoisomerase [Nisaea sp.]|jgi:1-deoxy-D-xylulose-5-phosphate reductoisomerase|nr:1-deoxy-D-xylulose-5-phosphate reductoisomerase [Nisaea sp.]
MKTISILGSTGSVGRATVDLIKRMPQTYSVDSLTANKNWQLLAEQAKILKPRYVAISKQQYYQPLKNALNGEDIFIGAGEKAIIEAGDREVDLLMAAIVGIAGLLPTISAIRRGTTVALANKECLVSSGEIFIREASDAQAKLIPVDSEHNAIFQVFEAHNKAKLDRLILTASGGPFRNCTIDEMKGKNPQEALAHPNWDMGPKISIDSATMMNKGLEIIEAHYLFNVEESLIDVVIHPQSIVHSLVSYLDGSVLAQLADPDMKIPIAYALSWPKRMDATIPRLDLLKIGSLEFFKPDTKKFPALNLARESINLGGSSNLVLNAANEVAVAGFLAGKIKFTDIVATVEKVLDKNVETAPKSIEEVIFMDTEIRKYTESILEP